MRVAALMKARTPRMDERTRWRKRVTPEIYWSLYEFGYKDIREPRIPSNLINTARKDHYEEYWIRPERHFSREWHPSYRIWRTWTNAIRK